MGHIVVRTTIANPSGEARSAGDGGFADPVEDARGRRAVPVRSIDRKGAGRGAAAASPGPAG